MSGIIGESGAESIEGVFLRIIVRTKDGQEHTRRLPLSWSIVDDGVAKHVCVSIPPFEYTRAPPLVER